MMTRNLFNELRNHMILEEKEQKKKSKITVYMADEVEQLLDEVFIKRLREHRKTDKSALLCEGIRLLYEKEIGSPENE